MTIESNNKRIAKNTIMLYIRMFITMVVGLYTGRIVLRVLGESDYGLNNVVAGFVTMMAYLNTVFVGSGQRFLSVALGKNDKNEVTKVFSTLILVHLLLAVLILAFAETFGLWYINNKLVIEPERLEAANWVYQCAICSLIFNVLCVPFNSSVITHEHMHVYAYLSILQVIINLISVFAIQYMQNIDTLMLYASFGPFTTLLTSIICVVYCKKHFDECVFRIRMDRNFLKEMFSFVGWSTIGSLGFTFKDQWINIVINQFCGTVVNAARGVAMNVNGFVNQFAQNFVMAVTPAITKSFASGDKDYCRKLTYSSAKLSFFLMSIIVVPLIINLRYVLELWLGKVPNYTYEFLIIVLCSTMISLFSKSTTTVLLANGDIKFFQIGISLLFLSEVPLAYLFLSKGFSPFIVVLPSVLTQIVGILFRFLLLHRIDKQYSLTRFFFNVVLRSIIVVALALFLSSVLVRILPNSFLFFLIESIIAIIITLVLIYCMGINEEERLMVKSYLAKLLRKK